MYVFLFFFETNALHWLRRIFDFNVVKSYMNLA